MSTEFRLPPCFSCNRIILCSMDKSSGPISIRAIAKALGLSPMTVSNIINDNGRRALHGEETQKLVLDYARKHKYRLTQLGISLRAQKTGLIGFVAKNYSLQDGVLEFDEVYPFLVGMGSYLSEHDYHVGLVEVSEIEQGIPRGLKRRFYDGLVIHWALAKRFHAILPELDLPVLWWDVGNFEPTNCLDRDETEVSRILTRRLIQLGHQQIGYLVGRSGWEQYQRGDLSLHYSYKQRYEGYRDELRRNRLKEIHLEGYDPEPLAQQIQQHGITAVVTQDAGFIHLMRRVSHLLKIEIPRDLSVVACDFEKRKRRFSEKADGISYDRYDIGQRAAEMMLKLVETPSQPVPSLRYTGDLVLGNTSGPAPTAPAHSTTRNSRAKVGRNSKGIAV